MVGGRGPFLGLLVAALLGASTLASPGTALAAGGNASSTHTFIVAAYAFARASEARIPTMRQAVTARRRSLLKQCPKAALGSPQDEQSYQLSYEAAGALWSAGYGADASPIAGLVKATKGLRWSNGATQRAVTSFVDGLHGLGTLAPPHLCQDIASWKASGFTTVPAVTKKFDAYVEGLEAKDVPRRLLAPYADSTDRALMTKAEHIGTKLLNFETMVGGDAWYALTEGLELVP